MDCDEFLRGYSDFRDRRHPRPVLSRFESHLEGCESCRRYDRVVRRGVHVLRTLPCPCPSSDFVPRLRHRIYHLEDGIPMSDRATSGGSAALTAMAAVGLLALAWLPFALQAPLEIELAPVAVEVPARGPTVEASVFDRGPWVTPLLRDTDRPEPRTGFLEGDGTASLRPALLPTR